VSQPYVRARLARRTDAVVAFTPRHTRLRRRFPRVHRASILVALTALVACSGEKKEEQSVQAPAVALAENAAPSVTPTGKNIVVELYSDEKGNYFKPNKLEVHRGDKITFTLASGVHNVHFLPDSNPKGWLPAASDMLQLPGQTYELVVALAPGKYYFQCDPHALLGMIGRLEVENER
jgi:plastocyanin